MVLLTSIVPAPPPPPRPPRRPLRLRIRIVLLTLAAAGVASLIAAELVLRLFLFCPSLNLGGLGRSIRQPARYSDGNTEDDHWKLVAALQGPAAQADAPNPDPITGWTGPFITPGTYEHIDEKSIGGRRPLILYGDSFAQCGTPPEECFQAILDRSEFAKQFALLNYGVAGYGLDQIYLLLEHSLDRFKDQNPIVIVSILVDSDFERSVLSFRAWPKPRLDAVGDRLVTRGKVQTNNREYLEDNPISIRSYLWRLFLHSPLDFLAAQRSQWRGTARIEQEKQDLNRRILVEIERSLARRGLQHFYVVFHSEPGALKLWEPFAWQEQMIQDVCAESSARVFDTRPFLSFASDADPEKCAKLYGHGSPLQGHHNAVGNLVCFEAIRQGLRGASGEPDMRHLAELISQGLFDSIAPEATSAKLLGRDAIVITHGGGGSLRATETSDPARLLLRADALGTTEARFELSAGERRFTGRLHLMANADQGCNAFELRFSVKLDDQIVLAQNVPSEANALALDIDLAGKRSLALIVEGDRGGASCNWICIENPRFE